MPLPRPIPTHAVSMAAVAAALSMLAGCSSPTSSNDPAAVVAFQGNNQSALVGTTLPAPLVAEVVDASANPISGQTVTWMVLTGGGTVSAQSGVTDANGRVQVSWTLGSQVGAQSVVADVNGNLDAEFDATGYVSGAKTKH